MSSPTAQTTQGEFFLVERHGDIAVIIPSPEVEQLPEDVIHSAAPIVLSPLKQDPPAGLIVDLSRVKYFGSNFISLLVRLHTLVKQRDSDLVLAGVNPRIRELLRVTNLDTLWALYDTRAEAFEALAGSD